MQLDTLGSIVREFLLIPIIKSTVWINVLGLCNIVLYGVSARHDKHRDNAKRTNGVTAHLHHYHIIKCQFQLISYTRESTITAHSTCVSKRFTQQRGTIACRCEINSPLNNTKFSQQFELLAVKTNCIVYFWVCCNYLQLNFLLYVGLAVLRTRPGKLQFTYDVNCWG